MRITQIHQYIPVPESKDGAVSHYISFQFYICVGERRNPQSIKKAGVHPIGFSSARASWDQISAWRVTWGSQSHDVVLRVVLFPSPDPLSENKNQPGSTSPFAEVSRAGGTIGSNRTCFEAAYGIAVVLPSWSVLQHTDRECGYRVDMFHRKYISLSPTFVLPCNQL